jgi:hypothetical protein
MNQDINEVPHFYFDEEIGKWISKEPSFLPNVIVISWGANADEMFNQFLSQLESFPVNIIAIDKNSTSQLTEELKSERIVACIACISQEALEEDSFHKMISTCKILILRKPEFRLFVQLDDGLTFDNLKVLAYRNKSVNELIESVHLSSQNKSDINVLIKSHLINLPRIQHRLNREQWESKWIKIVSFFTIALRFSLIITSIIILFLGMTLKNTLWIPLIYFSAGQLSFISLVNILTMGTRIKSGFLIRFMLVLLTFIPIYFFYLFLPFWTLNWLYFLAGGLIAFIMDCFGRSLIHWKKRNVEIDEILNNDMHKPQYPGHHSSIFLWKGPWFPKPNRVFISYSTRSDWGRQKAENLYSKFKKHNINCFFAPESIELGSSWRHRLKSELYTSNIFVMLLDEKTSNLGDTSKISEHWPARELAIASAHQSINGLPSIIIIYNGSLVQEDLPKDVHPYIKKVLSGCTNADISSLRLLKYEEDMEEKLTQELAKSYRWDAVSILPIKMAAVINLILMVPATILAVVGIIGSILLWVVLIGVLVMYLQHVSLLDWIQTHGFELSAFLMVTYILGFIIRLLAASGFEVWDKNSKGSFRWRLIETAILLWFCFQLGNRIHTIGLIYAVIALVFGIILGSFYLNMAAKVKGWIKS